MAEAPLSPPSPFRGVLHPSPRAEALRDYADRWHGQVRKTIPTDHLKFPASWTPEQVERFKAAYVAADPLRLLPAGAQIEYQQVCQCGTPVGELGCPQRRQLLNDADAIEQGRDFQDVADV